MKKIFSLLLPLFFIAATSVHAQTADEIVNKHIEARGGLEKLKALQTMIMEATMQQQGTDVNMKFYYANNKATKVEFTAVGQTGYNIVTATEGWSFNPFAGQSAAEAMTPENLKEGQNQLDLAGPLVDYKAKGHKVEYLGKESLQGTEYYKLKVTRANGKVSTYYLDKNYLTAQLVSIQNVNGADQEVTTEYSDYRKTPDGYMMAFKRTSNGNEIAYDKIEINPKIDDAVFKPSN